MNTDHTTIAPPMSVADGLRALADFLDAHPDAPEPLYPSLGRQCDYDEYTIAFDDLGLTDTTQATSSHNVAVRKFGPVEYRIQRGKAHDFAERELRIAERERELGITA